MCERKLQCIWNILDLQNALCLPSWCLVIQALNEPKEQRQPIAQTHTFTAWCSEIGSPSRHVLLATDLRATSDVSDVNCTAPNCTPACDMRLPVNSTMHTYWFSISSGENNSCRPLTLFPDICKNEIYANKSTDYCGVTVFKPVSLQLRTSIFSLGGHFWKCEN